MGTLFISHSSKDNDHALRVRDWLEAEGYSRAQVFLDLEDFRTGDRWRNRLDQAGGECEAVIVCLSDHWITSPECVREFVHTESRGKRIFPVLVRPLTMAAPSFVTALQFGDVSNPAAAAPGFAKLKAGLVGARIAPGFFPWPPANEPDRSVYRGLQALDVQDAAIFFGRDAAITRGLDELRRLRDGALQRMLVILGASGAGKSSFLRAGLIARLRRDEENFLVLPVIRPGRAAITGAEGLAASVGRSPPDGAALARAFADLRVPVIARLKGHAEAARELYTAKPPTIIVPIDQAEELFAADNTERAAFCAVVAEAIAADGNAIVVATIRSDSYEPLQTSLLPDAQLIHTLPPIAAGAFKEIIEGPARLAQPPLTVEPALTQQLLADLDAADALPLLAFTLERLRTQYGQDGKLTLAEYATGMGGLTGAIESAVAAVLGDPPSNEQLDEARALFIPALVQVDSDGVKRHVAKRAEISPKLVPLANRFIDQRILVTDHDTIEVAHETILRRWPSLAAWIDGAKDDLRVLDGVRAAAVDTRWEASTHEEPDGANEGRRSRRRHHKAPGEAWLLHRGQRLREAMAAVARPEFAMAINGRMQAYLEACRNADDDSRGKNIAIFFDGTWQSARSVRTSNIQIVMRSVPPLSGRTLQITNYTRPSAPTALSLGAGLEEEVLNAYFDLALKYDFEDRIYLFGYSRGAFSARSLASMIGKCGILGRNHLGRAEDAFRLYRDPEITADSQVAIDFRTRFGVRDPEGRAWDFRPYIAYLGVMDTVGLRGLPSALGPLAQYQRYAFHSLDLGRHVRSARHAVAIDERRTAFPPALFANLDQLNAFAGNAGKPIPYRQMWFAGTHSDMGGVGVSRLSTFPLEWIAEGAEEAGLELAWSGDSALGQALDNADGALVDKISNPAALGWLSPTNWPGRRRLIVGSHAKMTREIAAQLIHESVALRVEATASSRHPYRPPSLRPFMPLFRKDAATGS